MKAKFKHKVESKRRGGEGETVTKITKPDHSPTRGYLRYLFHSHWVLRIWSLYGTTWSLAHLLNTSTGDKSQNSANNLTAEDRQ